MKKMILTLMLICQPFCPKGVLMSTKYTFYCGDLGVFKQNVLHHAINFFGDVYPVSYNCEEGKK